MTSIKDTSVYGSTEMLRRKPSKALLSTTHDANESTYSLLAQACLRACMLRQKDVWYKLPYFSKIAEDFPRGIIVGEDGLNDIFKSKTVKMCDYLYEKGHLPANHRDIMLSMRALAFKEASVNKLLSIDKNVVDSDKKSCDNGCSEFVEDDKEE